MFLSSYAKCECISLEKYQHEGAAMWLQGVQLRYWVCKKHDMYRKSMESAGK